jgi:phosphoenolpyruvate carboxylase
MSSPDRSAGSSQVTPLPRMRAAATPHEAELPLEADLALLGESLASVLREQEGPGLTALIDEVLALAKRARSGSADAGEALRERLATLDSDDALPIARAFAHFLALANIAEQHHRVRVRRNGQRSERARGATLDLLERSMLAGVPAERLYQTVCATRVELVLTAHPTQALRRTTLQKHRRIAALLARNDTPDLTQAERAEVRADLEREIVALWQTDELRRRRPTPVDEARAGLVLFDQVIWDALPGYVRELSRALRAATGHELPLEAVPLRFGSWMGGDRDGNPNVTATVTEQVCLLARWQAAELYYRECEQLHDELSLTRASDELRAQVGDAGEPYRALLREVLGRLVATRTACEPRLNALSEAVGDHSPKLRGSDRPGRDAPEVAPYRDPRELWDALALCHRSLHAVGAGRVADGRLLDVLRRVAAFGLSLTRLDIRQESGAHERALDAVTQGLGLGSYRQWSEEERIAFLVRELESPRPLLPRKLPDSPELSAVLETLRACAAQPPCALGAYVISMAKSASDMLAVHLLQREVGLEPPLRVVPLFETLADLQRAGSVVARVLDVPWYRAQIAGRQEVMIGYSDSTKDAGRMAGGWGLFRAQEDVVAACREREVELTLFHGRGGTIGRGGGPIRLAILSQPPGSVDGKLRVTIQGETMDAFFGLHEVAVESFEHYFDATLDTTLNPPAAPTEEQRALMDRLAMLADDAYRNVVERDPRFMSYFRAATPVNELGRLNIGSRPARRGGSGDGDLGSLRAIPWMFAWSQTRLHLPAWLGTGEALTALIEEGLERVLQKLARDFPFFRSLLDLLAMVLSKADPDLAAYYDRVLVSDELRPLGDELRASCRRTIEVILRISEQSALLAESPDLRRTLELRNQYVDPLNLLQAELLRRCRATPDPRLSDALLVTVNGIAAGMRNTG